MVVILSTSVSLYLSLSLSCFSSLSLCLYLSVSFYLFLSCLSLSLSLLVSLSISLTQDFLRLRYWGCFFGTYKLSYIERSCFYDLQKRIVVIFWLLYVEWRNFEQGTLLRQDFQEDFEAMSWVMSKLYPFHFVYQPMEAFCKASVIHLQD